VALAQTGVDRIPPNNLEAEMAVLGSILVDREMMSTVSEILSPGDFYAHVHDTIFTALAQLYERGEPLDKITVAEELRTRGLLDKVGGLPYLTSLMDTVPTAASAEYYAQIVGEKSALRGLIHAGTQITRIGFENEEDVEAAIDQSEQIVYEVGKRQKRGEFSPIYKLLKGTFEQIDRLYHSRGVRTGLTSGFRDIDEYTAGFQPGNFVIVAARPGMGKTSMALTMAAAAAKEEQKPIAIFSLEMTNEELVTRLLCAEARINSQNLRRGNIKDPEWEKISTGMSALSQLPLYIDDSGTVSVSEIRSRCRRLQSGGGLAAVFIDYLQLVRPSGTSRSQNRNDELSEICRMLKATAKDLKIPIVALAQLNRGVESRNDKRPMLADLRDCLAGDSLVMNADTGRRIPVERIVRDGRRFNVWALDASLNLVRRRIVDAWATGEKPVFRVTTRSGRSIRCSAGHRFRTVSGWTALRDLSPGATIAVPRKYAAPSATAVEMPERRALLLGWLLGEHHLGSVPSLTVSGTEEAAIVAALARAEFGLKPIIKLEREGSPALRVVLATGTLGGKNRLIAWLRELGIWNVTASRKFVPAAVFAQPDTVVAALLRGLFRSDEIFSSAPPATRAAMRFGSTSETLVRDAAALLLRLGITARIKSDSGNIAAFGPQPKPLWTLSLRARRAVGHHAGVLSRAASRDTHAPVVERTSDRDLEALAFSDVLWDVIGTVEPCGTEMTYDITVEELHNFCVDDIITHNSGAIEQEADMVSFLYRDSYYNPESAAEPDLTEFIIAKSRNGPTGTVKLRFLKEHTLFVPYGDSSHFAGP
jgi:replicative DNA helicase